LQYTVCKFETKRKGANFMYKSPGALEIMIGSHAAANNLQVPEIGSYPHL
jgi:hypothetical protein